MPDRREEAALLPKGAAVGHDSEGVHLQGIVVVEAQRLMPDDPRIERIVSRLQPLGALSSNPFWLRPVFRHFHFRFIPLRAPSSFSFLLRAVLSRSGYNSFLRNSPPGDLSLSYLREVSALLLLFFLFTPRDQHSGNDDPRDRQCQYDRQSMSRTGGI